MFEVKNLPRGTKVRQAAFTQSRMFVLSEKGDVYVYKIQEHYPEKAELFAPRGAAQIKGELMVNEDPLKIKDIGFIK
jgi:hypothetical protein